MLAIKRDRLRIYCVCPSDRKTRRYQGWFSILGFDSSNDIGWKGTDRNKGRSVTTGPTKLFCSSFFEMPSERIIRHYSVCQIRHCYTQSIVEVFHLNLFLNTGLFPAVNPRVASNV